MDYIEIGKRIRKYRKAHRFSQEKLAEKVGISATHMSHIETANTKLSLPVFVAIADALSVRADELLHDLSSSDISPIKEEILAVLDSCSVNEQQILVDVVKAVKMSLDKNTVDQ